MFNKHSILENYYRDIIPVLPDTVSCAIEKLSEDEISDIEEIRLRANKPVMIYLKNKDYFLGKNGCLERIPTEGIYINTMDINKSLQVMCDFSLYSIEEELKQCFLTIKGGHRVGVVGRAVIEKENIKTIKDISGLNIRIAKEVIGCGTKLVKELYSDGVKHTLIASPPNCGKTTLLRDIVRNLSTGILESGIYGYKVGVVDERSEIAGCYLGIPQRDVGLRTDVLDACPKAQGIMLMLRSMSPEIIAVDEIGSNDDADAILNAVYSGVKVIATVHGKDINEILKKPGVKCLIENNAFERIVFLSRKKGPGTIEEIINV